MARSLCVAAVLVASILGVRSCAFTKQACDPDICSSLNIFKFDDLLNPRSALLNSSITFDVTDESNKGDWNTKALKNTLGQFFGTYNPKYNGGVFSADKWAVRDKAPSLNYATLLNSFGTYAGAGEAPSLSECCHLCRTTAGCKIYQFNPYVETIYGEDGETEIGRNFDVDGAGDCYLVFEKHMAKINSRCAGDPAKLNKPSKKPTFLGGYCNTDVNDDPHFVGARGTRYDFNGELDKSFCLLADTKLQVNTVLRGYNSPSEGEVSIRSWMKELGFIWIDSDGKKHTLQMVARNGKQQERGQGFLAAINLDGAPVAIPGTEGEAVSSGSLNFKFKGTRKVGHYEVDHFDLSIAGLLELGISMRVAHPKLQAPDDAEVHFNINLNQIAPTDKIHGVLGQTYRQTQTQQLKAIKYSILSRILGAPVQADGKTGKGFLEGEVSDYVTSSVTAADCKFSSM